MASHLCVQQNLDEIHPRCIYCGRFMKRHVHGLNPLRDASFQAAQSLKVLLGVVYEQNKKKSLTRGSEPVSR